MLKFYLLNCLDMLFDLLKLNQAIKKIKINEKQNLEIIKHNLGVEIKWIS